MIDEIENTKHKIRKMFGNNSPLREGIAEVKGVRGMF
jgi:hypothetical protein